MPGIVGIIGRGSRAKHEADLQQMIDCMMHEPFYQKGTYVNEDLGAYIGWICHPGSYADCMPVMNEERNVMLILTGEHFDQKMDARKLSAAALLEGYDRAESFLRQLNGWFCGVLLDLRKKSATLFNDRYGMQRVYFHEEKEGFLFGSEAKSLLKVRPTLRQLDTRALGELVSCNCVLEGRTLFPKISLLSGGSAWSWHKGQGLLKASYFLPSEWEGLAQLDEEIFFSRLSELAKDVIPRYFRDRGKVGMSLTGGLDSRMMMACLNPRPGELPCYTFGGEKDMLDITIARKVAELCGQTHTVIRLAPEFFKEFPRLAEKTIYVTDGTVDVTNTHDMYLNRLARDIAPIRVTGKFGSEVIRNHSMFNAGRYETGLFERELRREAQIAIQTLARVKDGHPLSVAVFRDFPWREFSKIILEQSQSIFRSPYMDNDLVQLMYQASPSVRGSNHPQQRIIHECAPSLGALTSDMGYGVHGNSVVAKYAEIYHYVLFKLDYIYVSALPHWLTKLDSLCLSVNGGKPLLGTSQKFEFYRIWFREELSDYVKEVLLDSKTTQRPYFNRKVLEKMVYAHTNGTRNYMGEINKAMTLELTCRMLIDA